MVNGESNREQIICTEIFCLLRNSENLTLFEIATLTIQLNVRDWSLFMAVGGTEEKYFSW
jgi:hypothetical protein